MISYGRQLFGVFSLLFVLISIPRVFSFVPAKIMTDVIGKLENAASGSLGKVSASLVHDEILKRGVIQSVVRFYYDQPNGSSTIQLSKMTSDYYNLPNLYRDYYGKYVCKSDLQLLIKNEMQPNVALIDFDPTTKDMPYAHFDAEKFNESNTRVMNFTSRVMQSLSQKDYARARRLSAQILHTIQDFYSHSNWVEMGNANILNLKIGEYFRQLAWPK